MRTQHQHPATRRRHQAAADGSGKVQIPADLAGKLKEHGIDADRWRDGGWKDWDKDKWLSEAKDFVNPVIEGLWKPERMRSAEEADKTVTTKDASAGQGVSDPAPSPVDAQAEKKPYHRNAAPVGKVFFDSNTWLAGPQLGRDAEALCQNMSKSHGGR